VKTSSLAGCLLVLVLASGLSGCGGSGAGGGTSNSSQSLGYAFGTEQGAVVYMQPQPPAYTFPSWSGSTPGIRIDQVTQFSSQVNPSGADIYLSTSQVVYGQVTGSTAGKEVIVYSYTNEYYLQPLTGTAININGDSTWIAPANAGQITALLVAQGYSALNTTAKLPAVDGVNVFAIASQTPTAFNFSDIDFPGAQSTSASGINAAGQIAGTFIDQSGNYSGFVYSGGTFTSFSCPANTSFPGTVAETWAYGINDSGKVVGYCMYATPPYSAGKGGVGETGFAYSGATFTLINYPGAFETFPAGIDASGRISGSYENNDTNPEGDSQGFLYSGGTFSTVDYANAQDTEIEGMNASAGTLVGYAVMYSNGTYDGSNPFTYNNGTFSNIGISGVPSGINDGGQVVGYSTASNSAISGFLFSNGDLLPISYPSAQQTSANGINDAGQVVGSYEDQAGKWHGFLANPAQ